MKRWRSIWRLCLLLWLGSHGAAMANPLEEKGQSTVLGGSLLSLGEVAMTFGAGFPDLFYRFDFANSKQVNLALQAKFNYNIGFSHFGGHVFLTAPVRFGIIQGTPYSFAVSIESGLFFGGGQLQRFFLGIPLELAALFSYELGRGWILNAGLELPTTISFEAGNGIDPWGWNIPVELMVGAEYRLNSSISLFAKLAGGPHFLVGNLASLLERDAGKNPDGFFVTGSLRLIVGVAWRR